ncbi:MAG TPA: peptidase S41, partial [Sphingopyxis sp.]
MNKSRQSVAAVTLAALMLASCGGGGSSSGTGGGPVTVTPTPTPTPTASCSLASRQAFAKAVIDEWYLFPNDVASGVNPASHGTVQSYIDALVAPARALNKDRFFTYITSIAE